MFGGTSSVCTELSLRFFDGRSSRRINSGLIPTDRHLARRQAVQDLLVNLFISHRPLNRQTGRS